MGEIKYILFFIILLISNNLFSQTCEYEEKLKIGLIENKYVDYKDLLQYEISKLSNIVEIEFNQNINKEEYSNYDLVFGEYWDLLDFPLSTIDLPNELQRFYDENKIKVINNLLPLDLDTFIIISNDKHDFKYLDEIANLNYSNKYTIGLSLLNEEKLLQLITYGMNNNSIDLNNIEIEYLLTIYKKLFKNMNKNILYSDYNSTIESFNNNENVYLILEDGSILNKILKNKEYSLFPITKYSFSDEKGRFIKNNQKIPYAFYGFSVYLNKQKYGLICQLLSKEVRFNTFENFDLNISPFSISEFEEFENLIPYGYDEILKYKNLNILDISKYKKNLIKDNILNNYLLGKEDYSSQITISDYLN